MQEPFAFAHHGIVEFEGGVQLERGLRCHSRLLTSDIGPLFRH